jgi:hypothetical protein
MTPKQTCKITLIDIMLESDEPTYQTWAAEMVASDKINFGDFNSCPGLPNKALVPKYMAEPEKFILADDVNILVLFEDRVFVHLFATGQALRTRYATRSNKGVLICPFEQHSVYVENKIGRASLWTPDGPTSFTDKEVMDQTGELFGFTGNILIALHHARTVPGWDTRG